MFVGQVSRVHLKVAIFHFLSLKLGKYPLKIFGGLSRSGECTPMVAFEKKTKRHLRKIRRAIREMAVSSACQLKSFLLFIYLFASVFFIFSIQNKKKLPKKLDYLGRDRTRLESKTFVNYGRTKVLNIRPRVERLAKYGDSSSNDKKLF
jgi:hypothetical protein